MYLKYYPNIYFVLDLEFLKVKKQWFIKMYLKYTIKSILYIEYFFKSI